MTTEEKLRDLILMKYKSIREFTQEIGLPYTTMDSILRRGVGNSSVTNIIKVCKGLRISVDALAEGEIKSNVTPSSSPVMDVKDIINDAKSHLTHVDQIIIDGKVVDIEYAEPIVEALDIGFEMAKKKSSKAEAITKTITESITKS